MSEVNIDEFFPEAAERAKEAKAEWDESDRIRQTHFGHVPQFQEVCDAFLDEMGWDPNPFTIKQVAAGGRDFYQVHGNQPELIRKTIRYVRKHEPDFFKMIASPRSLVNKARRFTGTNNADSEKSRRRYLKGTQ